ncbi:MAG: hypothetical protein E3J87_09610 [Candidatus Cloacimonadota bacterium]|nr:MAG: hypothetical protein E3J87_09610 [Candidatus Cloacimonadota bacterium]
MIIYFLTLGLFSINISPYLLIEHSIFEHTNTDTIYYKKYVEDVSFDSGYIVSELRDVIATGLTFSEKYLWTSLSLGVPCYTYSIEFLPFIDINTGFRWKNFRGYVGYHLPLKKRKAVDDLPDGRWLIEEMSGLHSIYTGIYSYYRKEKLNIGFNFQLRKEHGFYSKYYLGFGGYPVYPTPRNVDTSYVQTIFTTDIGYMFKGYYPFLFFSINEREFSEPLSFRAGLGIILGSIPVTPGKYEGKTAQSYHYWDYEGVYPLKPNIYLYPVEPGSVTVMLEPDGRLTVSDPPYENGWNVYVFPDGTIQKNHRYLFYEARINKLRVKNRGWCIKKDEVSSFFFSVLSSYGFNVRETNDFVSYWKDHLPDSPYYVIYPAVNKEIDKVCPLTVYPNPDVVLRVWFVVESVKTSVLLDAPAVPLFNRNGFVVTEWGVILE